MLEKSCVGHRAFETVVGKTCLVSQSVCLCHSKAFGGGASFPAFRLRPGLGKSTHPTVNVAPGSTPAMFPRYGKVTGRTSEVDFETGYTVYCLTVLEFAV